MTNPKPASVSVLISAPLISIPIPFLPFFLSKREETEIKRDPTTKKEPGREK